jgi:hypothetical protein
MGFFARHNGSPGMHCRLTRRILIGLGVQRHKSVCDNRRRCSIAGVNTFVRSPVGPFELHGHHKQ